MSLCDLCQLALDIDNPENFKEVSVWVNGPKSDGATARKYTGRVAHKECVDLLAAGQAPDNERLF